MSANRSLKLPHIPILYEDNHIIVVEKPVNIPSQADQSKDLDMLTAVKEDIRIRYHKPGNVYLGLVHRLDRPVGGAMVFAKTSKAASRLSEAVRTRSFDKEYMAVVHGQPPERVGRLVHYLWKDARKHKVFAVRKNHKLAKEAILDYRVIGTEGDFSLVHIRLMTGRTHQIRVQMNEIGCPLYGDQKYGPRVNKPGQQIALWSVALAFEHPVRKEQLQIRSMPPQQYPWNIWNEELYTLGWENH